MTTLDPTVLSEAIGQFPAGVTVMTAVADAVTRLGFTANYFSFVSLDTPSLLVCPGKSMSCFSVFDTCRYFAVNVLAEGQQDISNKFARYQGDRFHEISWRQDAIGMPVIDGAAVQFSCTTYKAGDAGDHIILIRAIYTVVSSECPGLVFVSGGYLSLFQEHETTQTPENH